MASGEHFELILKGECLGTPQYNVMHFLQTAGGAGASALGASFATAAEVAWKNMATAAATWSLIDTINLDDPSDFASLPITWVGGTAGGTAGTMPPWVTWKFKKLRNSRAFRSGFIRISGIAEAELSGLDPIANAVTKANALATILSGTFSDGSGSTWDMVIRSLPNLTYTTTRYGEIAAVDFDGVSSQVSRKA